MTARYSCAVTRHVQVTCIQGHAVEARVIICGRGQRAFTCYGQYTMHHPEQKAMI